MTKQFLPIILLAIAAASCSTKSAETPIESLTQKRDSLSAIMEIVRAEMREIDDELAILDTTRSFSSVTVVDVIQDTFTHSFKVYGNIKKAAKEKMKKLLKWKPKFNNINLILKNAINWEKSKTYLSIS